MGGLGREEVVNRILLSSGLNTYRHVLSPVEGAKDEYFCMIRAIHLNNIHDQYSLLTTFCIF